VIAINFDKGKQMITQAIKRWLSQMFAWWPWRSSAKTEYAPTSDSLNKGAMQGTTTWPATDGVGVASQPEIAPRRPTIEEWPERIVQPNPPALEERTESLPPPLAEKAREATPDAREDRSSTISPTPEKHLEFLRFLVKRGIVNEGFAEEKIPDQYRRES
jgi:hypothetical protein